MINVGDLEWPVTMSRGRLVKIPVKRLEMVSGSTPLPFSNLLETRAAFYSLTERLVACRDSSLLLTGTQIRPIYLIFPFLLERLVVIFNELVKECNSSLIQPGLDVTGSGLGNQTNVTAVIFSFRRPITGDPLPKGSGRNTNGICKFATYV